MSPNLVEIQNALIQQCTLVLDGDVDKTMVEYVHQSLLFFKASDSPDLEVILTSEGGLIFFGLDIYDALRLYEGKVTITVVGYAKSIAVIIFQAADVRRMAQHARLLIHNASGRFSYDALANKKDNTRVVQKMKKTQALLDKILATRTGKSLKVIRKQNKKDEDLFAEEALEFGLIDEIV